MTDSLQKAISQLEQMPADRQDMLARLVLHEIEEDRKWTESTNAHEQKLQGLVDDILAADERGECEPLDPEKL